MVVAPPNGAKLNWNPDLASCIRKAIGAARNAGITIDVETYEYCMAASYHARWRRVTTYFVVNGQHRLSVRQTENDQEIAGWIRSFIPMTEATDER